MCRHCCSQKWENRRRYGQGRTANGLYVPVRTILYLKIKGMSRKMRKKEHFDINKENGDCSIFEGFNPKDTKQG